MYPFQNLRHALRRMRATPAFAFAVIATLWLTVGLCTTVFSVLDAVFIRPLPYSDVDRIVALRTISPQGFNQPASYPEFVDWRRETHSFSALAAYNSFGSLNAELPTGAVSVHTVAASENFFDVFGVSPALGRTFASGEEQPGRENVAVLSDEIWHSLFDGRRDVLGAKIKLDGRVYTIVGVMPPGFRFPISREEAIYIPLHMMERMRTSRDNHWLPTIARLAPGVSELAATQEFNRVLASLGEQYPSSKGRRARLIDLTTFTVGNSSAPLRLLFYAVLLLMGIGCVNLAGLLLARGVRLEREVAVRAALGAGRWRLARQLLFENALYAAAGGALGVGLAYTLLRATKLMITASLARGAEVRLNVAVLAESLAVAIVISLLAGLWPALRLSGGGFAALRSGSRGGMDRRQHRLRAAFVSVQVALALLLLVTSGLVFRALARLQQADFGFDPSHILTVEIGLSPASYDRRDAITDFYAPLVERVRAVPGVRDAGLIQLLPIQNSGWNSDVQIVGQPPAPPNQEHLAEFRMVTPGYFRVFGVQLVRGRLIDDKLDTPTSQQVVVVNDRFVERFIPKGTDPIGQALESGKDKVVIVGVVRNVRQNIYDRPLAETDYPISQIPAELRANYLQGMQLVVRTAVAPESITQDLRRIVGDLDRTLPFRTPETMDAVVATALILEGLENWLFGSFAALALVLALVGLYGLISQEVELGRRDLGIRLAVGAPRSSILALVYRRVGAMLAIGLIAGMTATWAVRRVLATVVSLKLERDGTALLGLTSVFVGIALLAALIPARRAATVDPMTSLRSE